MRGTIEGLDYRQISDYVLVRVIGRGTHYTLYQAIDPRLGRMVVIKILHIVPGKPEPGADPELASVLEARLEREAHALSSLSHPGIPEIYRTGEQDGHPFLVMEYLVGHPLRQRLDCGPLSMAETLGILTQAAAAVDAIHAEGILHRDIRASNLMLLHDGRVKLAEFGLARQPDDATVTLMGTLVGEPAYLAPELLRGGAATPQSDLWALGVLVYEMLAGRPPFEGGSFPLVAHQVIMGEPAPVPGLPEPLQSVLARALEKDPAKRYPSARELAKAVKKAAGGYSGIAPAAAGSSAPPRQFATAAARPKPNFLLTAAVLVLLLASASVGFFLARLSVAAPVAAAAPR